MDLTILPQYILYLVLYVRWLQGKTQLHNQRNSFKEENVNVNWSGSQTSGLRISFLTLPQ